MKPLIGLDDRSGTRRYSVQTLGESLKRGRSLEIFEVDIHCEFLANQRKEIHLRDGIPPGSVIGARVWNPGRFKVRKD